MRTDAEDRAEQTELLTQHRGDGGRRNSEEHASFDYSSESIDSSSTVSASLVMMDKLNEKHGYRFAGHFGNINGEGHNDNDFNLEDGQGAPLPPKRPWSLRKKALAWGALVFVIVLAVVGVITSMLTDRASTKEAVAQLFNAPDSSAGDHTHATNDLMNITFDQAWRHTFQPTSHSISWIAGPNGEDGLMLVRELNNTGEYLHVEDVTTRKNGVTNKRTDKLILMKNPSFDYDGQTIEPDKVWPSNDLRKVLLVSEFQKTWRHSFTGVYWIFDVETQQAEPLDPHNPYSRLQLATWSPNSNAVVFTRHNNMFLRKLSDDKVIQITKDGGKELLYGVPDWVYEEEVFTGNSVTWWSNDGKHIAFLRTNETAVPDYPIQYFLSTKSGKEPQEGQENYPDTLDIKYPTAGAPNPIVEIQFYDVEKDEVFSVDYDGTFPDDDRLIIEAVWASDGQVLIRETNRESDILKIILVNANTRTAKVVRSEDIQQLDGGWVEPTQFTKHILADPQNGMNFDGYIDTVIHENHNHLALFSPINSSKPIMLTHGDWEVVDAPSAVDVKNGLVYFIAARDKPWKRHVYSVKLDGTGMQEMTNTTEDGYYDVSFSHGAGYALLNYKGPSVPWHKVISTPSNKRKYEDIIEENKELQELVSRHNMPEIKHYEVDIEGIRVPVMEYRPTNFDTSKRYPVLFHPYAGPNSQSVDQRFSVDFHAYAASTLGYIVVTVDGRGTGFIGRKARCTIRGQLGKYETHDQIAVAKMYAAMPWVDEKKIAIWGWSYGGYMTLKTLEQDAGEIFSYGVAVAPVTDFRFYDSIYTERYMHTPQHNPNGYKNTSVWNTTALSQCIRFLVMHGTGDDNVHLQNTLALLDKLDLAGVDNYDLHIFPDSDHSIFFHNANRMVYGRQLDTPVVEPVKHAATRSRTGTAQSYLTSVDSCKTAQRGIPGGSMQYGYELLMEGDATK
ncbi:hypothetical protein KEM54_002391 [Ascosphaera aggregata]|nr:hypothetical protein KEM54_002391 [Ascosphaera aggregata]